MKGPLAQYSHRFATEMDRFVTVSLKQKGNAFKHPQNVLKFFITHNEFTLLLLTY